MNTQDLIALADRLEFAYRCGNGASLLEMEASKALRACAADRELLDRYIAERAAQCDARKENTP